MVLRPDRLRHLPSVDRVLRSDTATALLSRYPRWAVVSSVRTALAERRRAATSPAAPVADDLEDRIKALLRPSLRPLINATGVVLHTNLGRAPLSARALAAIAGIAPGYSTLEYDPDEGRRASRHQHAERLLRDLTFAEAAAVVNNNAAAVLLSLAALAAGREVIVSRGELVEIGGSFRIPDVMQASGARLREVGTTNRTTAADYARAIGPDTALLLKVHRSNFALLGFVAEPSTEELAAVARAHHLPLVHDLGSGALVDTATLGLPSEPMVPRALAAGADLCLFSGDKLLGGPQAGCIVGRRDLVQAVQSHPLMRAVRPDKLTLAGLAGTLESYRDGRAWEEIPVLALLATPLRALAERAAALVQIIERTVPSLRAEVREDRAPVGGGALPLAELPTRVVALAAPGLEAGVLAQRLRAGTPPVVARVRDGAVLLDMRTVAAEQIEALATACREAAGPDRSRP